RPAARLDPRRRRREPAHPPARGRPRLPRGGAGRGRRGVRRGRRARAPLLGLGGARPARRGGRRIVEVASGAVARVTGSGSRAVVCANGGQRAEVAGTWSATLEWLVRRLAPEFPGLAFIEVRYRIKSWQRLQGCVEDCRAAIELAVADGAREVALLGFSMGGAVAIASADSLAVPTVIGLVPWIPYLLYVMSLYWR